MRRASFLRLLATLAVLFVLLASARASAQLSETDRKAAARAAYAEGVTLRDEKRFAEALVKFDAAQKLFDAPTHLLNIAQCQAQTGKLVEAQETYEVLIRRQLGANPPEAFVTAQKTAEQELPALRARIPTLRVAVKPNPAQLRNLQVLVNNVQVPLELLGIARPVNPGPYKLNAAATGWATPGPTEIDLRDGDQRAVELTLVRSAASASVVVPPAPPPYVAAPLAPPARPVPAPPLDAAAAAPKPQGSSDTGLLFGARAGVFVPGGSLVAGQTVLGFGTGKGSVDFDDVARTGGGFGGDLMLRVGRTLLLGGGIDWASLGNPSGAPSGYAASTLYYGALLGLLTSPDKTAFYGDITLGRRSLDLTRDAATGGKLSYVGSELGLGLGVMVPAGPLRILPKVALNFGEFSTVETCVDRTSGELPAGGTCSKADNSGGLHTMIFAGLGMYYHLDLGKKK
jgi:hypothetical protein